MTGPLARAGDWPWYPLLATAAYVIGAWGATYIPVSWLTRPLAVGVLGAALLIAIAWLLLRSRHVAGLLVIMAWAGVTGYLWIAVLAAVALVGARLSSRVSLPSITKGANLIAAIWVGITLAGAVPLALQSAQPVPNPDITLSADGPNIYLLLLDGYARSDTLAALGLDNEPFLEDLEKLGFSIGRKATGAYTGTVQTVASMLWLTHVDEIPVGPLGGEIDQRRTLRHLIEAAPAMNALASVDYQRVFIAPGVAEVPDIGADVVLDSGHPNEFEVVLIQQTALDRIMAVFDRGLLHRSQGERVRWGLEVLAQIPTAHQGPLVVYAHLLSPHAPFAFESDGGWAAPPKCFPRSCGIYAGSADAIGYDEFRDGYTGQLQYLNALVLEAIESIVTHDPDAAIVVFSDHGSRYSDSDIDEKYRTLFAARTPGQPGLFTGHEQPTSIFTGIFRAYFGLSADWPARTRFVSTEDGPLAVVRE